MHPTWLKVFDYFASTGVNTPETMFPTPVVGGAQTIGHWTKDAVMDEEYLMWDNQELMKQLG